MTGTRPKAATHFALSKGVVAQQAQARRRGHAIDGDAQCLLPAAHRAVIKNGPIEACQSPQALRHAHGLA